MKQTIKRIFDKNSFHYRVLRKSFLVIALLSFISFIAERPDLFLGLIIGGIASSISFVLISYNIEQQIFYKAAYGRGDRMRALLVRYAVMAAALILAIKLPALSLPACVAGLFMPQIAIVLIQLLPEEADRTENQEL